MGGKFAGTRRYQVVSCLGAGGMGVVYQVLDRDRWVQVALKTLRQLDGDSLLQFKHEFRALQGIAHPNLVGLGELGEEDGVWFFTMELIDGVDFLSWVRPGDSGQPVSDEPTLPASSNPDRPVMVAPSGPTFDDGRLRRALRDLARGLSALHAAGKVHRDIKPSNLRVDGDGRLVLLDFGLIADADRDKGGSDARVVGTAGYMAPEQAASRRIGPEADWYSVGVALYEALTGRLPFSGPQLAVLLDKQQREPPPPRAVAAGVPEDLDRLCAALLRTDPGARAGCREVLAAVGDADEAALALGSSSGRAAPFIGRGAELGALDQALRDAAGSTVTVLVRGPSGVGKSALVARFTDAVAAPGGATVLAGRCSEREAVPYKALDGVVDGLSRHLAALPAAEVAALLPAHAGLLVRAFPVLLRVEAIARVPRQADGVDPQEQRLRLFAALRELLIGLAARAPLVLAIDDLQWADEDSLALLAELLRPPDGPRLLLLATVRPDGHDPAAELPGDVRTVAVDDLPAGDARRLAEEMLGGGGPAARLAQEAAGHPLLLLELVRHVQLHGDAAPAALRLEDAIAARVDRLAVPVRRLLELLAVAAAPLSAEVVAHAARGAGAAADLGELDRGLAALRVAHLCRASGRSGGEAVEVYHDRVRAAVIERCPAPALRGAHERLALALEAAGRRDLEALAVHWQGAGDPARAAGYARDAGDAAAQALAFERAARLYRSALAAGADPAGLRVRLADALASAGHGAEAAEVFLEAAAEAGDDERAELRRRAAEQFLRSGRVGRGMEILDALLRDAGLPLATTRRRALLAIIRNTALLALRGRRPRLRPAAEVPPALLARIDLCWSVSSALSTVDTFRSADLQVRGVRLALRAGEPFRLARALSLEAGMRAIGGARGRRRGLALLERADELAAQCGEPYAVGVTTFMRGLIHHQAGEWAVSHELCGRAEALLRDHCSSVSWELVNIHGMDLWNLGYLGRLDQLGRCLERYTLEARERGDDYAASLRSGIPNLVWLARGDVDGARRDADEATGAWAGPDFALQHYYDVLARAHIDLYEGDAAAAAARVDRAFEELRRAMILRIEHVSVVMHQLRARCAIAGAGGDPARLRAAARDLARVDGRGMPWADGLARLARAGAASAAGDAERAALLLDEAIAAFTAAGMELHGAVARRQRGRLIGGNEGEQPCADADAWMADQRVSSPAALAATLAPGFPR